MEDGHRTDQARPAWQQHEFHIARWRSWSVMATAAWKRFENRRGPVLVVQSTLVSTHFDFEASSSRKSASQTSSFAGVVECFLDQALKSLSYGSQNVPCPDMCTMSAL
jgi:hypothetical protein